MTIRRTVGADAGRCIGPVTRGRGDYAQRINLVAVAEVSRGGAGAAGHAASPPPRALVTPPASATVGCADTTGKEKRWTKRSKTFRPKYLCSHTSPRRFGRTLSAILALIRLGHASGWQKKAFPRLRAFMSGSASLNRTPDCILPFNASSITRRAFGVKLSNSFAECRSSHRSANFRPRGNAKPAPDKAAQRPHDAASRWVVARASAMTGDSSDALTSPLVARSAFRASSGGQSVLPRSCDKRLLDMPIERLSAVRFSAPGRLKYVSRFMGNTFSLSKQKTEALLFSLSERIFVQERLFSRHG